MVPLDTPEHCARRLESSPIYPTSHIMLNMQHGLLRCQLRGCMVTVLRYTWSLSRLGEYSVLASPHQTSECLFMNTAGHLWTVFSSFCQCSKHECDRNTSLAPAPLACLLAKGQQWCNVEERRFHKVATSRVHNLQFFPNFSTVCCWPQTDQASRITVPYLFAAAGSDGRRLDRAYWKVTLLSTIMGHSKKKAAAKVRHVAPPQEADGREPPNEDFEAFLLRTNAQLDQAAIRGGVHNAALHIFDSEAM